MKHSSMHRRHVPLLLVTLLLHACADGAGEPSQPVTRPHAQQVDVAASASDAARRFVVQSDDPPCGELPLPEGTLLDGAPGPYVTLLGRTDDRLLIWRGSGWVLWDTTSNRQVASGGSGRELVSGRWQEVATEQALHTGVMVIPVNGRIELRAVHDGALLQAFDADPAARHVGLTPDGSVVWTLSATGLTARSRTGVVLGRISGNTQFGPVVYGQPVSVAVSNGVLSAVVDGVLQRLRLEDGQVSRGPAFAGVFHRWFSDGRHFVTLENEPRRVHVYDHDGQELHVQSDSWFMAAGGFGEFLWTYEYVTVNDAVLHVYRLGNVEPVLSLELSDVHGAMESYGSVAVDALGRGKLFRIGLRGPIPRSIELRLSESMAWNRYASDSAGGWALRPDDGNIHYGSVGVENAPIKLLGCGRITEMAGARTGHAAVATDDGRVRIFDRHGLTPDKPVLTLAAIGPVALSEDAKLLLTQSQLEGGTRGLRAFSVPDGALIGEWSGTPGRILADYAMSRDGKRLALVFCQLTTDACEFEVRDLQGNQLRAAFPAATELSYYLPAALRGVSQIGLSPTGTRLAVSETTFSTAIYDLASGRDGSAQPEERRSGRFAAWFDDEQLVLKHYAPPCEAWFNDIWCGRKFQGVTVDRVGSPNVEMLDFDWFGEEPGHVRSDGARIYFRGADTVYAWPSREVRYGSADTDVVFGDLVGDATVVVYGTMVTIDPGWQ